MSGLDLNYWIGLVLSSVMFSILCVFHQHYMEAQPIPPRVNTAGGCLGIIGLLFVCSIAVSKPPDELSLACGIASLLYIGEIIMFQRRERLDQDMHVGQYGAAVYSEAVPWALTMIPGNSSSIYINMSGGLPASSGCLRVLLVKAAPFIFLVRINTTVHIAVSQEHCTSRDRVTTTKDKRVKGA
ncbi:hypothetical protein POSPLADRAFT_1132935 [Postia placenta MAD-698-R-SB12]|uniref:Uncharacterized protein n=1 Tax=Postia placenta MAD-698-R-SB12 TaxID=670580 RepID=A0A1X6NC30_9APHY|nr:hypothetical protein POSPLADRAFT_1132935 [Postia placenta MAD-698-R-SB12]OSX65943.1 hypothetical protein POSPLADRAFT_1132935 [Postia placenta MAD-698-R-SB12]